MSAVRDWLSDWATLSSIADKIKAALFLETMPQTKEGKDRLDRAVIKFNEGVRILKEGE